MDVCEKHNKSMVNASKFKLCENFDDVGKALFCKEEQGHPIYCLKESCIEKYVIPNFDCANPPGNYNKRVDGPKKADVMDELPTELSQLFKIIFGTLGLGSTVYKFEKECARSSEEIRITITPHDHFDDPNSNFAIFSEGNRGKGRR